MTPNEALEKTADLLEEKGWCRGTYARNAEGMAVCTTDSNAVAFCVVGGLRKTTERAGKGVYAQALVKLITSSKNGDITTWNDRPYRTRTQVVEALRKAAQLEQETPT